MRSLLVLVFMLAACAKSDSDSSPPPRVRTPAEFKALAVGSWRMECFSYISDSQRIIAEFGDGTLRERIIWYDGKNCVAGKEGLIYESTLSGAKPENADLSGWGTFSYVVETATATPKLARWAEAMTKDKVFGFTQWKVQETKDITGRAYSPDSARNPFKGTRVPKTFKTDGAVLQFAVYKETMVGVPDPRYDYKRAP